jgi:multidrug efflux pump subunit AcrA (membrane-fusion protein)
VVTDVFVQVGTPVKKGDPLFKLDDRTQQAELVARQASLASAQAQLARLKSMPRPEEVPLAEARVKQAEVQVADMKNSLGMREGVTDKRAISEETVRNARFAVDAAQAKLRESQADLALLKAGAWAPEIAVAEADVKSAEAQVAAVQTELDRLTVKAPVDGEVLQVKIRAGEYAQAGPLSTPLMVVGDVSTLNVRVDVDEHDAWRIKDGAPAKASVRGNAPSPPSFNSSASSRMSCRSARSPATATSASTRACCRWSIPSTRRRCRSTSGSRWTYSLRARRASPRRARDPRRERVFHAKAGCIDSDFARDGLRDNAGVQGSRVAALRHVERARRGRRNDRDRRPHAVVASS